MTGFLNLLGVLSIIGGLIGCFLLWPDSSELLPGYMYKSAAYLFSIISVISGIVSSVIFFALSKIITLLEWSQGQYNQLITELRGIKDNTNSIKEIVKAAE